jgi:hypothetical protein
MANAIAAADQSEKPEKGRNPSRTLAMVKHRPSASWKGVALGLEVGRR